MCKTVVNMNPKIFSTSVFMIVLATTAGCLARPPISPTADVAPYSLAMLIDDLRARGLTVDPHYTEESEIFSVTAEVLYVNEAAVRVYQYRDGATAALEAAYFSADGEQISAPDSADPAAVQTQLMSWPGTPHVFQRGELLVLYTGDFPALYQALEAVLGPQVAGGAAPDGPPTHYDGVALPPPPDSTIIYGLPPAWLVWGDQALPASTLAFTTAFLHADPGELVPDPPSLTLPSDEPVLIVFGWPISEIRAVLRPWTRVNILVSDVLSQELVAEPETEGNPSSFRLDPTQSTRELRLDVFVRFSTRLPPAALNQDGSAHYVWRLNGRAMPAFSQTIGDPSTFDCHAVVEIPVAECLALLSLYSSTGGGRWEGVGGWLTTDVPCSWTGVTCNGGHVRELDLSARGLNGSIPAELGSLAKLRSLNLVFNQLSGTIPVQLANLSELEELFLAENQLSGDIPAQLSKLSNLRVLNLASNQLTGAIPAQLGDLIHLEGLSLYTNELSGPVPGTLGKLANLRVLFLVNNRLTGSIPSEIGDLSNLEQLNLSGNQLSGPIPDTLGRLANLRELELQENQLSGAIPAALGSLANLQELYLTNNQLEGPVPADLGNLSNLRDLGLSGNRINGPLPEELGQLRNLTAFDIGGNPMSGPLPHSFTQLTLDYFWYVDTGLCEPTDEAFQHWLAGISDLGGTGVPCD